MTALVWAVSVGALAAAFAVLHWRAAEDFKSQFHERVGALGRQADAQLGLLQERLGKAVERVSADPQVGFADSDLAWEQFYDHPERQREIARWAPTAMKGPDLDALFVLDASRGGRVIALGHRLGLEPDRPDLVDAVRAEAPGGRPWFGQVSFESDGKLCSAQALLVGRQVGRRLVVVGGWLLGDARLGGLLAGAGPDIRIALRDAEGQELAASFPAWGAGDELAIADSPLPGIRGGAILRAEVPTAPLRARTRDLARVFASAGAIATLAALLLGWGVSRRISRPIEQLARATARMAEGEWGVVVPALGRRDEVGRLVEAFNAMSLDLADSRERALRAERVAAWRDVARQIAHEIKNPLFPIQTSIETLQRARARRRPDFDEIFGESTALILEEVERLKRIVSAFSRFAQLPVPQLRRVDAGGFMRHVYRLYRDAAPNVHWDVEGVGEGLDVLADEEQMVQVVTNLVANAIDAVGGEGHIRLVARAEADHVVLAVDDDGPGVPPEERERIFRPYATTKAHGSGLGLAIVHRIATEHGGEVSVTDSSWGGASFQVRIPRTP